MSQSQQLTIRQTILRAERAVKQGNTDVALELYNAVLQQQPNHLIAKKRLTKRSVGTNNTNPARSE